MKYLIVLLMSLSLIACKDKPQEVGIDLSKNVVTPEGINTLVPDEVDGGEMLLGEINFDGLQKEPFTEWFELNYNGHSLDTTAIDSLKPLLKKVSIKVFMGTWCEDSQREVPALLKILEAADYKMDYLEMVAVTHDKDTPDGLEADYEIEYVPTIIFYKDGSEINRIVEYPQQTLEQDMLTILKEEPYKHTYAE